MTHKNILSYISYNYYPEMKYPILALFLITFTICSQDVPIYANQYGFSVGDQYGTLHIQFFLDFQCPDSKDSFIAWTNVRKAVSLQQNKVKLTFQFNPLPYHFYAPLIHEAFFYVLKNAGATSAEDFMAFVFDKQEQFTEEVYINKTTPQFISEFSTRIASRYGLDATALGKELVIGSQSFKSLKDHWRYTTIVNGVSGAPAFYANGVRIDGAEDYTYLDWINFIKQYRTVTQVRKHIIEI